MTCLWRVSMTEMQSSLFPQYSAVVYKMAMPVPPLLHTLLHQNNKSAIEMLLEMEKIVT
jgi:hypothetical protein